MSNPANNRAIILMHCPDQKGLVADITDFLHKNNGNIIFLDQHVDEQMGEFFMRVEWDLTDFIIPSEKISDYFQTLIATKYQIKFWLYFSSEVPRVALFVSKLPHCLHDILSRVYSGEWNIKIPLIISNHREMEMISRNFRIDYRYLPVTKENKPQQEAEQIRLLKEYNIDFLVLARYMQILSPEILNLYTNRIINIHHSFLPAFPGAKPYHSAYERGVKIIGATSHYVTEELDAGPIIAQDVVRITHKDTVDELIRKGKDLEKMVLSRAIWYHLQRRVLVYGNKTIVFD